MRTLLILIITGFVLLNLGSPEKMQEAGEDLVNVVKQLPERAKQIAQQETMATSESPDFTDVGHQADIPAAEVLGQPITPETEIISLTSSSTTTPVHTYGHQDRHSIEEIHAINASALEILDRISASYQ